MIWQDTLITTATIIFAAALIPQIYYGFRYKKGSIAYATSAPTFICLYAIGIAYFTLNLFLSTIMSFVAGTLWLILLIQKIIYNKNT